MLEQNSQPYVLILVVILLLIVLLWFLLRNPWKAYAARITAGLLASNPELKKIDWSPISPPDAQGIRTTSGTYEMTGGAGAIKIIAYGKNEAAVKKFTGDAKFHFAPIFEKLPSPLISRLLEILFGKRRSTASYQKGFVRKDATTRGNAPAPDLTFEQNNDLSVEFALQAKTAPGQNDASKPVQAIAFIIDPRLAQSESTTYWANVSGVYEDVSVSEGSVNANLNLGGTSMGGISVVAVGRNVLSSSSYGYFYSTVTGTSGTNYYRLSGTWNVE